MGLWKKFIKSMDLNPKVESNKAKRIRIRIRTSRKVNFYNRLSKKKFNQLFPEAICCNVGMPEHSTYEELEPYVDGKKVKFWKVVRTFGIEDDDAYQEWCVPVFYRR